MDEKKRRRLDRGLRDFGAVATGYYIDQRKDGSWGFFVEERYAAEPMWSIQIPRWDGPNVARVLARNGFEILLKDPEPEIRVSSDRLLEILNEILRADIEDFVAEKAAKDAPMSE